MAQPTRVLIADDSARARDGLRALLTIRPEIEVVGEATNGQDAVRLVAECRPDIVLMDLHMPVLDGLIAMKQIRKLGFSGPVVGLTADFTENHTVQRANEGWDAMCAKPINRQVFLPLLARLMQKKTPAN